VTAYTLTVETVGQEREPVRLVENEHAYCGRCPMVLHAGDTVWAFDDVPVGSSPGSACCTSCMLAVRTRDRLGHGALRLVEAVRA
jgi:hypothetical protein